MVGAVATFLGPILGPFALIVFGALAGSLLAMSKADIGGKWAGARYLMVGVLLALALAGSAAWAIEHFFKIPGYVMLMPLSAAIGAGRDLLLPLIARAAEFLGSLLIRRGG